MKNEFLFQIITVLGREYFHLPFVEAKKYLTREIDFSVVLPLHAVMGNSCTLNCIKKPATSANVFSIEYNSANGDYFTEINGKKYYSIKPEDLGLKQFDIISLSFLDDNEMHEAIRNYMNQNVRYEDEKVVIY